MRMKIRTLLGWCIITTIVTTLLIYHNWGSSFTIFIKTSPRNASEQYVIYLCDGTSPCGGWADRQKGILSAYMMAHMMGRRFRVRITIPCDLTTHLESNGIPWEITGNELQGLSTQYVKAIDRQDNMAELLNSSELESHYQEDIIYLTVNMEYVASLLNNTFYTNKTEEFRDLTLDEIYTNTLRQLFKLKPPLQKQFDKFVSLTPRDKGVKLICAQVRLGKNPTVPTDSEEFNTLSSVSAVWDFLHQYDDVDKYRIFVTSDSEEVRRQAHSNFSSNILDTEGEIVHVDRVIGSDPCNGFGKVILDQLVLSTCDVLTISRSGLARIAAWYRGKTKDTYCFTKSKVIPCNPFHLEWLIPSW